MADEGERPTVTIDVDGEDREVELPDGFLTEDQVREKWTPKSVATQERERAEREAAKKARKEASKEFFSSDDALERFIEVRGEDEIKELLGIDAQSGNGAPTDADLDRIRKKVHEQEVAPLEEQNEALETRATKAETRALKGSWSDAIRAAGVDKEGGTDELVELWLKERTSYDPDHGPVALGEDGKPDFVLEEGGKHRPKTPTDLLLEIKKSGERPSWFEGSTRPGVGAKAGSGGGRASDKKFADMSKDEKIKWRAEHTLDEFYEKLGNERAAAKG